MNRLRVLKQRAARSQIGVCKVDFGQGKQWVAAHGHGWGCCSEGMTRRQAIQLAARWALPYSEQEMVISYFDEAKQTWVKLNGLANLE